MLNTFTNTISATKPQQSFPKAKKHICAYL